MSWGERSCKHLYEKDPMKNPCHPTMEACNVNCSRYEWDGKTKPDSTKASKLNPGIIVKFGDGVEGRVRAAGRQVVFIDLIGRHRMGKQATGKKIGIAGEMFTIVATGKHIRLTRVKERKL